ncbi:hypothetical protein Taro_052830 [Colocasia esculenta]|uniref:Uncharacterized protein n=1 Tax=Colocasia esculenta TaxID=4460 RepID=A0A843XJD6_COLES|nr:hypothetical protein [Colocasia esculenta]
MALGGRLAGRCCDQVASMVAAKLEALGAGSEAVRCDCTGYVGWCAQRPRLAMGLLAICADLAVCEARADGGLVRLEVLICLIHYSCFISAVMPSERSAEQWRGLATVERALTVRSLLSLFSPHGSSSRIAPSFTGSSPSSPHYSSGTTAGEMQTQKLERIANELLDLNMLEWHDYSILFRLKLGLNRWCPTGVAVVATGSGASS